MNCEAKDVTQQYQKGAEYALKLAQKAGCRVAILKAKSPSCGKGKIYSGRFDGKLIDGDGVTAQLLRENGIEVLTEKELEKLKNF